MLETRFPEWPANLLEKQEQPSFACPKCGQPYAIPQYHPKDSTMICAPSLLLVLSCSFPLVRNIVRDSLQLAEIDFSLRITVKNHQ